MSQPCEFHFTEILPFVNKHYLEFSPPISYIVVERLILDLNRKSITGGVHEKNRNLYYGRNLCPRHDCIRSR